MANPREKIAEGLQFLREARGELEKVVWPTWNETRGATIVVLIVAGLIAGYLGAVDFVLSQAIAYLVSPNLT